MIKISHLAAALVISALCLFSPPKAEAIVCSPAAHNFVTGETLTAVILNANPLQWINCFANIDNTNIGAAGIYASQIIPTSTGQATFGGAQPYKFATALTVAAVSTFTGQVNVNTANLIVTSGFLVSTTSFSSPGAIATNGDVISQVGSSAGDIVFGGSVDAAVIRYNTGAFKFANNAGNVNPYQITAFTGTGTFTTPANSSAQTVYRYRMVGAGGGGGGANGTIAAGGGGGAGGYAEGSFTGIAASTGVTITVASGGSGGVNTGGVGGLGGSTVIGSPVSVTCTGGGGGNGSTAATPAAASPGVGGSCTGGSPSVIETGGTGGFGNSITTGVYFISGTGASSAFGNGGIGTPQATGGGASNSYGGGGGGAGATTAIGGAGGGGLVIIERETF